MDKQKNRLVSTFSAQITATISVSLVLLILGVIAMMGIAARNVTRDIKESMGFTLVMGDATTDSDVNALKRQFAKAPYVASYNFYSADDALRQWEEDTGESISEILEINPFSGEFEVRVKEIYASPDSLNKVADQLKLNPAVGEVTIHLQMVETINRNISNISLVLIVIAGALLMISFVLINNTVRLTIYSRRFIIHTMKLVGATPGFIRRPFIFNNMIHGVFASLISSGLLAALLYYAHDFDPSIANAVSWQDSAWVFGGLLIIGILICCLAALFATNKYIRLTYDEMFK